MCQNCLQRVIYCVFSGAAAKNGQNPEAAWTQESTGWLGESSYHAGKKDRRQNRETLRCSINLHVLYIQNQEGWFDQTGLGITWGLNRRIFLPKTGLPRFLTSKKTSRGCWKASTKSPEPQSLLTFCAWPCQISVTAQDSNPWTWYRHNLGVVCSKRLWKATSYKFTSSRERKKNL